MADRKKNRSPQKLLALSRRELVARLSAAEEALRAIRSGEVDAIVVNGQGGEKVFTLQGADHTYRVFVERMNEGAAVLSSDHTVLHCNGRFARFLGAGLQSVIGSSMLDLVWPDDHPKLDALLRRATQKNCRGEIRLRSQEGTPLPVQLSLNPLHERDLVDGPVPGRILCRQVKRMHRIVSVACQHRAQPARQVGIHEKPHASARWTLFAARIRRENSWQARMSSRSKSGNSASKSSTESPPASYSRMVSTG